MEVANSVGLFLSRYTPVLSLRLFYLVATLAKTAIAAFTLLSLTFPHLFAWPISPDPIP